MRFKEFFKLSENLWGPIPVQGKKPSDGVDNKSLSSNTPSSGNSPAMPSPAAKMMRKKMNKK